MGDVRDTTKNPVTLDELAAAVAQPALLVNPQYTRLLLSWAVEQLSVTGERPQSWDAESISQRVLDILKGIPNIHAVYLGVERGMRRAPEGPRGIFAKYEPTEGWRITIEINRADGLPLLRQVGYRE